MSPSSAGESNRSSDLPSSREVEQRYQKLRADLTRAVRRVCPGWLRDRQDDLVQVATLKVMDLERRQAERGEGNRELQSSYLYRVAYSAMVDEIRRIRRRGEVGIETEEDGYVIEPTDDQATPEERSTASQRGVAIRDCLAGLKLERRRAVTLYLSGNTVPESAGLLDWTVKKTENLVYRGLADLRRCLTGKGIEP